MDNPGSCNTDSLLGNHPNKILIMKPSITFNTQDEYETILWNYTALKNKFYPKSK